MSSVLDDAKVNMRLNHALKIADRSGLSGYHTGAVIYARTSNPVAHGWSHYSMLHNFKDYPRSIHAELHAILRTTNRDWLSGSTIYIANMRPKSGNVANGKPCAFCQGLLFEAGIRTAYYTIDKHTHGRLDLADPTQTFPR